MTPLTATRQVLPVHHQLLEFIETHVYWVGDAIQLSHPLSSPSPPSFNLSQYQGLFQWVSSLHQVARVLEFQLQRQSFQWIFRTDFLSDGLVGSTLCYLCTFSAYFYILYRLNKTLVQEIASSALTCRELGQACYTPTKKLHFLDPWENWVCRANQQPERNMEKQTNPKTHSQDLPIWSRSC